MKRSQHRLPRTCNRNAYPSDLTDAQWALVEPLVPAISPEAAYVVHTRREIVNAILYLLRSGCPWRMLPHEFPAWGTVYDSFRRWQQEGVWDSLMQTLRIEVRKKPGRDPEPSAAVIDSQSIKTSAVRGPEKGYDAGKKNLGAQTPPAGGYPGQSLGHQSDGSASFRSGRWPSASLATQRKVSQNEARLGR